ncbi:MAG: hypothetical protein OXD35_06715 [Thiotrichales bacterium]|nr:hypothetical protein [Thiotrichales bacterium]
MANLASALKEEISRVARKEIRQQTAGTIRTVAQCEREIAALKRQIGGLQRMLSPQRKPSAPEPTARKKTGKKKVAAKATEPAATARTGAESDSGSKRSRFSAKGLKTHREQLGLSADSYGKLVGVSGLSIYNWEQEKARPRESSIAALASIRGLGKREAASRLGEPATPKAKAKTTAKTKATPTAKKKVKVKAKTKVQANRSTKKAKAQSEKKDG